MRYLNITTALANSKFEALFLDHLVFTFLLAYEKLPDLFDANLFLHPIPSKIMFLHKNISAIFSNLSSPVFLRYPVLLLVKIKNLDKINSHYLFG